jgi:nitrogen regulatory protein P-II 1
MKEIKAIIQPHMADKVIDGLRETMELPGLIVSTVNAFGGAPGDARSEQIEDEPMTQIEIVVPDALAETVIATIVRMVRTGRSGDGKVFVREVADVIRIRDGDRGESVL